MLSFVYGPDRAQRELSELIRDFYPSATAQETRIARQLVEGRGLSLGVGLLGTLLAVTAIRGSLDTAVAHVLGKAGKRTFVRGRLEGLGFAAAIVLLAVASFGASYGMAAAQGALVAAGLRPALRVALEILSPVAGVLIGYVFFVLVYRVAPRVRVARRHLWKGALVAAVLWEAAKLGFAFFTRAIAVFAAYGPVAFAAGLLTWVYLTAVIILIGAEVIKVDSRPA